MAQDSLDEREFELINIIGTILATNQRDISRQLKFSLGQTNMLLRRLITKGYIRINQLNKRKVEYILTPKGFAEKMQKSIKYTLKTIESISVIKNQLKDILSDFVEKGERDFFILGERDFSMLVESALNDVCKDEYRMTRIADIPENGTKGVLLIGRENIPFGPNEHSMKMVNLIEILAAEQSLA